MARRTNTATVAEDAPVVSIATTAPITQNPQRPPVDAAVRQIIADRLRDEPLVSHQEIASELGVSRDFVSAVSRKLNGTEDLSEKRMRSLTRQIGKRLSIADRAMIYESLARGTCNPKAGFVQKAALTRIEELEGIVTRKEQREVADNSIPILPPMFILNDADVDIGVQTVIKVRKRK